MLEGLLAVLALFLMPHADQVRAPEPLVELLVPICSMPPSPDYLPPTPVFVSIRSDGAMLVDGEPQGLKTLGVALKKKVSCNADGDCNRIFIRADEDTPYTTVLSTMSAIKHNGFTRIALIDESDYD